jgi:apolipoprotein N-acyltransferase
MQAASLGYACGVLWYGSNCYWIYQTMHIYGGLPGLVSFGILVLFSLYLGLYHALFAWVVATLRTRYTWVATLGWAPCAWVALELARERITGFPWDLLGYSQVDNYLLAALAPLGGVMALSFVIVAVNALFAMVLLAQRPRTRWILLSGSVLIASGLQAGTFLDPPPDTARHSAVLLQENLAVGVGMRELAPITEQEKYRQFITLSKSPVSFGHLEDQPRDLIVWPEAPADFATSDPAFRAALGGLARSTAAPVIAGSLGVDLDSSADHGYHAFGSAAVFNQDGIYLGRYDKIHRVPWGEYVPYKSLFFFAGHLIDNVGNLEAGTQHKLFRLHGRQVGIFICYESIFGDEVRQFVDDGAEVLVNISDDGWYGDSGAPWQHLDMARMRAIENRRWVLRDTNTGVTASIDPHGRGDFFTPRHVRQAFVFPFDYRSDITFYTRHGDWFAWLCAILTLGVLALSLSRRQSHLNL